MIKCESVVLERIKLHRKLPREVYKATLSGKEVLVKEKGDFKELEKEYTRTDMVWSLLNGGMRIPKPVCGESTHKRLLLEYFNVNETLDDILFSNCHAREPLDLMKILDMVCDELVKLHLTKIPNNTDSLNTNRRFEKIEKILDMELETIKTEFEDREDDPEKAEKYVISNISKEDNVLSHGDFKPNNVLISKTDIPAIIDWVEFGIAIRQLDLGSILFFLDEPYKGHFLNRYLNKTITNKDKKSLEKKLILPSLISSS